jgi:hypothetical protein
MPVAIAELDRELTEQRMKAQAMASGTSVLYALVWLLTQDFARIPFVTGIRRRHRLKQLGVDDRRMRRDLSRRTARLIVIARRQVVAPKAQLLLNSWKKVHVPFTILLTAFSTVHIWEAWSRAW